MGLDSCSDGVDRPADVGVFVEDERDLGEVAEFGFELLALANVPLLLGFCGWFCGVGVGVADRFNAGGGEVEHVCVECGELGADLFDGRHGWSFCGWRGVGGFCLLYQHVVP